MKPGLYLQGRSNIFLAICCALLLVTAASAQDGPKTEGAALFGSRGCVHCHAATGEGTDLGPSLRDVHRKLKAQQIRRQIVEGGGAMPAFGTSLSPAEVDALVAFLRAKTWIAVPVSEAP